MMRHNPVKIPDGVQSVLEPFEQIV
jgi:hypothetical protein